MDFNYSLKYPMDMNVGNNVSGSSVSVPTYEPSSIFNKTQFNTYATTSAGGGSGRRQYVAANDPEKHFNALKALVGKEITTSNYHLLDLDGDEKISISELLSVMYILKDERRDQVFAFARCFDKDIAFDYNKVLEIIRASKTQSKPLCDIVSAFIMTGGGNYRAAGCPTFQNIIDQNVTGEKANEILGDKEVVTSVDLLRIFGSSKNVKLPKGKKDLFEAIPADFSLDREKFDEVITFYCSDPFDLGGFLKACDKADPYREADKPRNVSTQSKPAPSRPSTPAPSRPNTPRAQNSGKLVPLDADDPQGNKRRIRGLVMTGALGSSSHSSDNFDISNNEYIDGYELLGLNDKKITAALKAHPNFAMSLKDFKNDFGAIAFDKGSDQYNDFKENLLAKINASGTGQNRRCSDLIKIRELGIITAETLEAIDVNNDGWIEAAEFALAGIDIKNKEKNVATMAKLKEKVKAKRQVNIQDFFDEWAIDSSQINPDAKKTGKIYKQG